MLRNEDETAPPAVEAQTPQGQPNLAAAKPRARLDLMDWIAIGLLVCGVAAVATKLLPLAVAEATVTRIFPLLVFLGAVIVLAELAAKAELFDVIAVRLTALGKGRNALLFLLSLAFAACITIFLNLDTTAVLLTPVLIATARRARLPVLPFAMSAVWLANTASLLLPVSNLTNLLAADRIGLAPLAFAARMALPQLAALVAIGLCLWWFYWRTNPVSYPIPERHKPRNPALYKIAAGCVGAFVVGILLGISVTIAALVTAIVLLAGFAWLSRAELTWQLLPWRLLVFVTGLFLVMDTVGRLGLSDFMAWLIGTDPGDVGVARAATVGAVSSNVLNNLPSYVAGEAVVPIPNHDQLIGLLIGTNVGPLVLPWASLATLIWYERCRADGLDISWPRFIGTGLVAAALTLAMSVGALLLN